MKKAEELHLLEIPEELWQEISIDIIGLLPRLNDKDVIVIIMNQFSKIIKLKTTITTVLQRTLSKSIKTKSGNYMEYYKKFLVTENLSLLQNS